MRRLYWFLLAPALVAAALPAAAQILIATVPVGINSSQVAGNTATNTIYVANACGNDPKCGSNSPGTVTVINGASNTVTKTVTVGLFPLFLVVNPATNKIYVTNFCGNDPSCQSPGTVTVIDGNTNIVLTTIAVGAHPNQEAVNSITNEIYVANGGNGQGTTMSVIDGNTNTVSATVTVGNFPGPVAVNPATNMVYVTNYCGTQPGCKPNPAPGTVSVIDGATNTVTNTVTVGDGPFNVFVNQVTNKIWVQNTCGNDLQCEGTGNSNVMGTVTQVDGTTLKTSSANTGNGSAALAINRVTNQVYVSNKTDNTETFIDGVTLVATTVNVGNAPADVEVDPVTDKIYVCDSGNKMVTAIDGATLATTTVGVGNGPSDAWVNPITNRVYVSNSGDNTVSVLAGAQIATTTTLTSKPNPSNYLQLVLFTATVTASNGGSPTGTVTFTAGGNIICNSVPLGRNGSTADCQTSSLAIGTHNIQACYSGDVNFAPGCGTLTQMVLGPGDFTVLVTPGSTTITQGFNNNNDPFFAQTINVTAQPQNGYNNTVTLSCSVSPLLAGGSCAVQSPSSGSLAPGNLNTTLTISAGSSTPVGCYTVTVTGQDNTGLMHTATLALSVINYANGVDMPPGGSNRTPVSFGCPAGTIVSNLSCPLVAGTGITGTENLSKIGGVCTFNPGSVTTPGKVIVTISGCTVARLRMRMPIFASFFLGIPGVVLLGSLHSGSRRRKKVLRILAFFLIASALLVGLGCGGYGQLTPTGNYYVLVQGTGANGTVSSAVVPVTVTPLNN